MSITAFLSVAQLRLANLTADQIVRTVSYYERPIQEVKGGSFYKVIAPANYSGTPDEIVDHTLNNGNIAQVYFEEELSAFQAGAVGDYDTDDGAAIQAWLDYASTNGVPLFLPEGVFRINDFSLDIPQGIKIRGVGNPGIACFPQFSTEKDKLRPGFKDTLNGSVLIFSGTASKTITTPNRSDNFNGVSYCVYVPDAERTEITGISIIQDMDVLDVNGAATTGATDNRADYETGLVWGNGGIYLENVNIFGYFDVRALNYWHDPSTYTDPADSYLSNVIVGGGTGILGNDGAAGASGVNISAVKFYGCVFNGQDHHTPADGDYTVDCILIDATVNSPELEGIDDPATYERNIVQFYGCRFESYKNSSIRQVATPGVAYYGGWMNFPPLSGVPNADSWGRIDTNSTNVGAAVFKSVVRKNNVGFNSFYNAKGPTDVACGISEFCASDTSTQQAGSGNSDIVFDSVTDTQKSFSNDSNTIFSAQEEGYYSVYFDAQTTATATGFNITLKVLKNNTTTLLQEVYASAGSTAVNTSSAIAVEYLARGEDLRLNISHTSSATVSFTSANNRLLVIRKVS